MGDTLGKQISDISDENYGISPGEYAQTVVSLFESIPYFSQELGRHIGVQEVKDLYHLFLHNSLTPYQYKRLRAVIHPTVIKDIFENLDIEELNASEDMPQKIDEQILSEIAGEFQAAVLDTLDNFGIFDETADKPSEPEIKYRELISGDTFSIYFSEASGNYFLSLEENIFLQTQIYFGTASENPVESNVSFVLFECFGETYIFDFRTLELIHFAEEYLFDSYLKDDIVIWMENRNTMTQKIYSLTSKKEFSKSLAKQGGKIHQVVDYGSETLVLHTKNVIHPVEMADKKLYKNKESTIHLYSLERENEIASFSGELDTVVAFGNGVGIVSFDTEYTPLPEGGFTSSQRKHIRIAHADEIQDSLESNRISLPLKYETFLYPTRNDIILVILFPPERGREKESYNIISMSGKVRYINVSSIENVVVNDGIVEIYFTDTEVGKGYFNSDYNYAVGIGKRPMVQGKDLH